MDPWAASAGEQQQGVLDLEVEDGGQRESDGGGNGDPDCAHTGRMTRDETWQHVLGRDI
jgi:hypothetical protein